MLVKQILVICLIKIVITHVTITNPSELSSQFSGHINATYSNFGKVPYGQLLIGRIYYDVYNTELDYACKALTGIDIVPENRLDRVPIVMVDRGNCTFVTKVRNVQRIGGALALVIDNIDENLDKVLMTDDGTGSDIFIPALMITKSDGDRLKAYFMQNKDNASLLSSIVASIEFKMVQSDIVNYQIFFSSANKKIYRLLKEFYPYYLLLREYTKFTPHYISHESSLYNENSSVQIDNCLSNGRYCASPRYDLNVQNGKDILLEDIRQKCLYNLSNNKTDEYEGSMYMKYMLGFYQSCINSVEPKFNYKCAYEVLDEIDFDTDKVKKCVVNSFQVNEENILMYNNNNTLLEQDYEVKNLWKVKMLPTVMVNNKTILGASTAENLFEAICSGFITKPLPCDKFFNPSKESESNTKSSDFSAGSIFLIIAVVIMLNVAIIYVCKRYVMKKIHERVENVDINGRINNVVTSYLALRDTK